MMCASAANPQQVDRCPDRETLVSFSLGKLPTDVFDRVEQHLLSCLGCQQVLDQLDVSDSLVRQLRLPDGKLLRERAFQELRSSPPPSLDTEHEAPSGSGTTLLAPQSLPRRLGQYELGECIGQGAMGTVYKARHVKLKREVALKLLSPRRLSNAEAVARFSREMEAIGSLDDHPNIVRARDAAEAGGYHFLVMDYVEGIDAGRLLAQEGRLALPDACEVVRQAALGLDYAHAHGMVHRDMKPGNLMLSVTGEVKVLDLGLVFFGKEVGQDDAADESIVGTADYMAPEQWSHSAQVNIRADVYSLGCTLYKLLVGEAPYRSATGWRAKMTAHLEAHVPSLRDALPNVPAQLDTVFRRMVAKEPALRFARPREVAAAIEPFTQGSDLARLVKKARIAQGETCSISRDTTYLTGTWRQFARRWRERRTWLIAVLTVAAMVLVGMAVGWLWVQSVPRVERVLCQEPRNVLWEYDRARKVLHVQSSGIALFQFGELDQEACTVGTNLPRVKPAEGQATRGIFLGYPPKKDDTKAMMQSVELVGLRQRSGGQAGDAYEVFRSTLWIQGDLATQADWVFSEIMAAPVPYDPSRPRNTLEVDLAGGQLQRVLWNGEEVGGLGQDVLHPGPGVAALTGPYGVFSQDGTAKFHDTRVTRTAHGG